MPLRRFSRALPLLFLSTALLLGLCQWEAKRRLVHMDRAYAQVDEGYRRTLWSARYIQSAVTEADLQRFIGTEVKKNLSIRDVRVLRGLRYLVFLPGLRRSIGDTLNALKYYLEVSGMEQAEEGEPRTLLGSRIEGILHAFKASKAGCELDYGRLNAAIINVELGQKPPVSMACLEQAALELLGVVQGPLADFRKAVMKEKGEELWSSEEMARLRDAEPKMLHLWWKHHRNLEKTTFSADLETFASPEKAEEIVRWFYGALGFNLDGITLEKHPRPNLNSGGEHFAINPPTDQRVLIPLQMSERKEYRKDYMKGMVHEFGHGVYFPAVKQELLVYRHIPDAGWYGEGVAELFVLMFLEPEVLKRAPSSLLARHGNIEALDLHYMHSASRILETELSKFDFESMALREPSVPLIKIAEEFLARWPRHYFNTLTNDGLTPRRRQVFTAFMRLEALVRMPLYSAGYVKGAFFITALAAKYFRGRAATWEELQALSRDLRSVFVWGGSLSVDQLARRLGVDMDDKERLMAGYERYFGLK